MTLSSWQNKLNMYFMFKTLVMKGGQWFCTGTQSINVEDDDSLIDTYVSPLSTQISPNVIGEEVDDVHANRNDHDEGELINII